MPTDHLNPTDGRLTALVEAVLSGAATADAAAVADLPCTELAAAVDTYRHAGRAALADSAGWFHAAVQPADWATAETVFRTRVGPRLDQFAPGGWWFLRKHPSWRVRIRRHRDEEAQAVLDDLTAAGVIGGWTPGVYEPEENAFGGQLSTAIVHDLFCADSRETLAYARHQPPPLGRRELSLLLLRELTAAAGLDWYETGDLFHRVAQIRPTPDDTDTARIGALTEQIRLLFAVPADAKTAMFAAGGPAATAAGWRDAFTDAGRRLGETAATGALTRGLRAVLTHVTIFHWNRLGLPTRTQAILAHAATRAVLPEN